MYENDESFEVCSTWFCGVPSSLAYRSCHDHVSGDPPLTVAAKVSTSPDKIRPSLGNDEMVMASTWGAMPVGDGDSVGEVGADDEVSTSDEVGNDGGGGPLSELVGGGVKEGNPRSEVGDGDPAVDRAAAADISDPGDISALPACDDA